MIECRTHNTIHATSTIRTQPKHRQRTCNTNFNRNLQHPSPALLPPLYPMPPAIASSCREWRGRLRGAEAVLWIWAASAVGNGGNAEGTGRRWGDLQPCCSGLQRGLGVLMTSGVLPPHHTRPPLPQENRVQGMGHDNTPSIPGGIIGARASRDDREGQGGRWGWSSGCFSRRADGTRSGPGVRALPFLAPTTTTKYRPGAGRRAYDISGTKLWTSRRHTCIRGVRLRSGGRGLRVLRSVPFVWPPAAAVGGVLLPQQGPGGGDQKAFSA